MRTLIKWLLRSLGWELNRIRPAGEEHAFNSAYLRRLGDPATVFDVGVGRGTYPLYEAYPRAKFVLVEPARECEPYIRPIQEKYDCIVHYKAVGSAPGQLEFNVDLDDPEKSSLESRERLTVRQHELDRRIVEVTTLDALLKESPDLKRPIFLKLDTEGHELEALRGAAGLLQVVDFVIAEVSVASRFKGGYRFEDVIEFMRNHGFRFADIIAMAHAPGEIEPRHMDVVFRRTT
jgi:FkbM family methyltransferase